MRQERVLFVDLRPTGRSWVAVASAARPPLVLESIRSIESLAQLKEIAREVNPKSRYTHVVFGGYPASRFVRHGVLENPSKAREDGFFEHYLKEQYQIDLDKTSVSILNPAFGLPVDLEKVVPKELLFCGAEVKELMNFQNELVGHQLYPDRLELTSVATLGGLVGYLRAQQIAQPAVILEWGQNFTTMMIPSARRVELIRSIPFGSEALLASVCQELGLKDAASAQKLLSTAGFDLMEMGGNFLKRFLKELQASTGFFEVQTGHTIKNFLITLLPDSLKWVEGVLAKYLGAEPLLVDYEGWAHQAGVRAKDASVDLKSLTRDHFPLFSMLVSNEFLLDENKKVS